MFNTSSNRLPCVLFEVSCRENGFNGNQRVMVGCQDQTCSGGRLCCTVFRSINTSVTQTHHFTKSRADREAYRHL